MLRIFSGLDLLDIVILNLLQVIYFQQKYLKHLCSRNKLSPALKATNTINLIENNSKMCKKKYWIFMINIILVYCFIVVMSKPNYPIMKALSFQSIKIFKLSGPKWLWKGFTQFPIYYLWWNSSLLYFIVWFIWIKENLFV